MLKTAPAMPVMPSVKAAFQVSEAASRRSCTALSMWVS